MFVNTRLLMLLLFLFVSYGPYARGADWHDRLRQELPVLGHRNWIVVADSAYPSQTAPGIKTIYAGGDHLDAVKHVLQAIDQAKHVRPVVYLDEELNYVPEEYARGIGVFRGQLKNVFGKRDVHPLKHEEIIKRLDQAGQTFHVLMIKTDLALPYTSVFIRLDAGYWSDEGEAKLREAMRAVLE